MTEELTIIVLNWNGKDLTLKCLKSLEKITYSHAKILLVDNGSTDDTAAAVKLEFPQVEILQLEKNLGYAGGNNAGFEFVKNKINSKYIIFLNNDTIVDPGFAEPLLQEFSDPLVGQTVPKIFYADQPDLIWFGGSIINMWTGSIKHAGIREKDREKFMTVKTVDYATGCCICMRTSDFDNMQGFDQSFPMYGEDVDLSLRLKEQGKKILFVPESYIWHKVSASLGGAFSLKKLWRRQKGNWKLMWKHASLVQMFIQSVFLPLKIVEILKLWFSGIFNKKMRF